MSIESYALTVKSSGIFFQIVAISFAKQFSLKNPKSSKQEYYFGSIANMENSVNEK
jgi:hypothetical protein